jgi:serine/threonine protein kinase
LKGNITRILRIADILNDAQYNDASASQTNIRKLPAFFEEHQKKIIEKLIMHLEAIKDENPDKFALEKKEEARKTLQDYNTPFYQSFDVHRIEFLGKLTQGGYADIFILKADVTQDNNENVNDKYLLAKVPKKEGTKSKPATVETRGLDDKEYVRKLALSKEADIAKMTIDDTRIQNEREILSIPTDKKFQFIARYYDDKKKNPILYMEHYMPLNLHHFTSRKLVSLQTAWYWMFQMGHFLRYARENGIIHLDLKPENVVIAKNYFLKVIDFAESLIKGKSSVKMTRGHTFPFTAPEVLANPDSAVTESDTFSFAHILYTIITGKKLMGYKRNSNNKLSQKYRSGNYRALPFKESFTALGPKFFMKYAYFVVMFCLAAPTKYRLPPEDIILIFYELMNFSEKLF